MKIKNLTFVILLTNILCLSAQRQMEHLDRGTLAVRTGTRTVLVSWRILAHEFENTAYNVYFNGTKVNSSPISDSSNFLHNTRNSGDYTVTAIVNGAEQDPSEPVTTWEKIYKEIPLTPPAGGFDPDGSTYSYGMVRDADTGEQITNGEANDASVGDLDGDGEYEIVLKWMPSNTQTNAYAGYSGPTILQALEFDGTVLWTVNLGINIRSGSHYAPFLVYDFDGDGKAEVACRTSEGTTDGLGDVIGNPEVDYRNTSGKILEGPEYISVFSGETGAFLVKDQQPYDPPRGDPESWGDSYGNRVNQFMGCVAYLDGVRPSMVFTRGYYDRTALAAFNFENGALSHLWTFDTKDLRRGGLYEGQGNHSVTVGDVDLDGKDEIVFGSLTIDDDGNPLNSTGYGHGDSSHLGDFNPDSEGLEYFTCHEAAGYDSKAADGAFGNLWTSISPKVDFRGQYGLETILWQTNLESGTADIGRSLVADIDPNHDGAEAWSADGSGIYDINGNIISTTYPESPGGGASYNMAAWYDGDLLRELVDRTTINKWNAASSSTSRVQTSYEYDGLALSSNNSTKSNPCLIADIIGDWREEIIWRASDNTYLAIMTTPQKTDHRIFTLMHDPVYRTSIAWQNVGYNQSAHTGFFLGANMPTPLTPNIFYANSGTFSFEDDLTSSLVSIYPNPSSDEVTIANVNNASVKIYNVSGKLVFEEEITNQKTISLKKYGIGLFFAKIKQAHSVETFKVIIK